jgi:hypothetical protein
VSIAMRDAHHQSIFGTIDQQVAAT